MSEETRYRAGRLRHPDGSVACWGVFREPAGVVPCMMAGFTGRGAWWRSRRLAARMNRESR